MDARHFAGLLVAAGLAATAVLADVKGGPSPPAFTAEETELIDRDPRLMAAAAEHPWHLRCALDAWHELRRGARRAKACPDLPPDPGRASTEGPFDLLQILKEAAGGGTKR
jgi:hypothetical protein